MNFMNISLEERMKQKKSNDIFENIKSDYFLQKIIGNIKRNKSLEIMKYNKKLQKRLNLSIKDYKEYSQLFSPIEIELKTVDNKYEKFINIYENKEYYHIYFDDSKDEIKRSYLNENEKVKIIKIIIDHQITSLKSLFLGVKCISSIFFKKFNRINITDMSYMFHGCSSLKELNLSKFNTNNVTDMSFIFSKCSSLKELNLSKFNTYNVTNMTSMFYKCSSLKEINISNFNTNKVTNMSGMFAFCSSLHELNLSNFNTNNVIDMTQMFYQCSSLKELNLSNFNTDNVIYMSYVFEGCSDELVKKIKNQNKNIII